MTKACEPLPTEFVVSRELLEDYKRFLKAVYEKYEHTGSEIETEYQAKINAVNDILSGV